MNVIDFLLGEHAVLRTLFGHLERQRPRWTAAEIRSAGQYLESLLAPHALLEDELLFDALPAQDVQLETVLAAMTDEHRRMGQLLSVVREVEDDLEARRLLGEVLDLTREHFEVEERVLFTLAAQSLGPARLHALAQEWARRRLLAAPVV